LCSSRRRPRASSVRRRGRNRRSWPVFSVKDSASRRCPTGKPRWPAFSNNSSERKKGRRKRLIQLFPPPLFSCADALLFFRVLDRRNRFDIFHERRRIVVVRGVIIISVAVAVIAVFDRIGFDAV